MKASYNWLKDFVDFELTPKELAHTLTMAGLEVEAIEEVEGDTVFDIGITPNRADCLNIRGIAREISTILETPLKDISAQNTNEEGEGPSVEIKDQELCPRYSSRIVTGIKPGPSPEWLSKRLESCGIRSMLNIVDITNYILLELGQPMHAFDFDKLSGKKIIVRRAGDSDKITTLDNEERKLSKDMLLICDAEKPVAVAGVMGGLDTEVTESTVNVLLESAYFNPSSVRRTAKQLNLSTESSYRFERGVDREAVTLAMDRAAQLITEIAGGTITEVTDNYPEPYAQNQIQISFEKINSIIGIDIEESFIEKTLRSLGCQVERAGESITIVPPSFRGDIEKDFDIIEEVARLYGYDNIPSTLPVMQMSAAPEHKRQELTKKLKESLVKSGYSEVINFSFMNPDSLDKLNMSDDDSRRKLILVKNPLRKEDSAMRTTLVPALLTNLNTNLNRGEKMLRFFEISKVFLPSEDKLPEEIVQLGVAYHKETVSDIWANRHEGFYDLKGVMENVLSGLKIKDLSFSTKSFTAEPYMHPGKSCAIIINNVKIGVVGTLHPAVAEAYDIKGDVTIAEIYNIEKIIDTIPSEASFIPLPKFPYIERDIALVVHDSVTVNSVKEEILSTESDIIESVKVFDVYKGKPIPQDKKSLAFAVRYRSTDKTLTDAEVDAVHADILGRLQDGLNAELRS